MKKLSLPKAIDLLALAVIAIFFAFVRLEAQYGFEFDQERDYNVVKEIVGGNLTLIGPRVVSSAGFFLGPYYYYLNAPFFVLFRGEPLFAAYFTGFINIVITFLIYFFLRKETKGRLIPFLAAAFWITGANRSSWNVSFVPLFFLSFLYFFSDLLNKWRFQTVLLLTLLFSFSLHFHAQMIFLVPLWLYSLTRHKLTLKQIFIIAFALMISFLPLVFFDLRHEFVNSRAIFRFLTTPSEAAANIPSFRPLYSLRQFSTGLVPLYPGFKHNLFLTSGFLLLLSALTFLFRRFLHLLLIIVLSIFVLGFYREPTWPEYYHYLSNLSVLLLVFFIGSKLPLAKWGLLAFTAWVIYQNYFHLQNFTDPGSYFHKKSLILYLLKENQPYEKLNIENDFRYGEGLGFGPIRQYYEETEGEYHPSLRFYVSYAESLKHNQTKKTFGLYGVSKIESVEKK